jgi:hypothetical protein
MNEIILNLNVNQVNTILACLVEAPYKVSAELIAEIKKQAEEQLKQVENKE